MIELPHPDGLFPMQRARSKRTTFWTRSALSIVVGLMVVGSVSSNAVQIDNVGVLRDLLDSDFDTAVEHLAGWNRTLIRDLQITAPEDAIAFEARMEAPETIPSTNILPLAESNFGRGLVTFLFDENLSVEQVNLLFCDERVGAIQVLFDDVETFGDTEQLLSCVHGMGPAVPFGSHAPAFRYPLPGVAYDESGDWSLEVGGAAVTVWNMGTLEALYQPVAGQRVITGQFWLTSRELASQCAG